MKITENYMEKVYAGWLGKIIGIRLGAPIEGWTYQRIRDVFGEVWSYPADYKNFPLMMIATVRCFLFEH